MRFCFPLIFLCLYLIASGQEIQIGNTTLTQRDVAIDLQIPWEILWGPDDHIWATERRGRVLRIDPQSGNTTTILNIENKVYGGEDGEPGMLGMALHPKFPDSSYVYLVYTYGNTFNIRERLVRYTWDGSALENEDILLNDIPGFRYHDGSRLLVTHDQKLLMTTGDKGDIETAQDLDRINGKILRINLDGSIPDDNPFANSYVYSYGHRNPQGLCQAPDGTIYSSEHGPMNSDEINIIYPATNYGWPYVQGACNTADELVFCNMHYVEEPIAEWSPCIAVNGIEYYNHSAIPEFRHSLIMAVLGGAFNGRITHMPLNASGDSILAINEYFMDFGRIRDVCFNPHNGAIYFVTNGPEYPGSGPNRLIEYRNRAYVPSNTPNTAPSDQYIRISPNPVETTANIEFSKRFLGQRWEVMSFSGKRIFTGTVSGHFESINVSNWPSGTYFVRSTNSLGTITRKFVVR